MWNRPDNQEVGLEAAILERVRNSSLVQWFCAENVPGLKRRTEAADRGWGVTCSPGGRGALATAEKARRKALAGAWRSANAGMSSVKAR
jgi:hypothetical protein